MLRRSCLQSVIFSTFTIVKSCFWQQQSTANTFLIMIKLSHLFHLITLTGKWRHKSKLISVLSPKNPGFHTTVANRVLKAQKWSKTYFYDSFEQPINCSFMQNYVYCYQNTLNTWKRRYKSFIIIGIFLPIIRVHLIVDRAQPLHTVITKPIPTTIWVD
jgi:hypothetical protein